MIKDPKIIYKTLTDESFSELLYLTKYMDKFL